MTFFLHSCCIKPGIFYFFHFILFMLKELEYEVLVMALISNVSSSGNIGSVVHLAAIRHQLEQTDLNSIL